MTRTDNCGEDRAQNGAVWSTGDFTGHPQSHLLTTNTAFL